MTTSMKKIEIYCDKEASRNVVDVLKKFKVYWYEERVNLEEKELCRMTFYAPIYVIDEILGKIQSILDLRKRENLIVVIDVESGLGTPYRVVRQKWRYKLREYVSAPQFMIVEDAMEKAEISPVQPVLSMVAGVTALIGLLLNNPYIIIGSMLISPILGPIYSLSLGLYWRHKPITLSSARSLTTLIGSALLAALVAILIGKILDVGSAPSHEILTRTNPGLQDIVIPLLLGVAGVFSIATSITEALTGVAVAAAIIPPTATVSWTIVYGSLSMIKGSVMLLMLNILGLIIGGIIGQLIVRKISLKYQNTVSET